MCERDSRLREYHLIRSRCVVSARASAPADARILSFPVRGEGVSVSRASVRLGKVGVSIYYLPAVSGDVMRNLLFYRVLCYLDDLLIAPRGGRASNEADCLRASGRLYHVLAVLGIVRHATKGVGGKGAREMDHLGFHLSTVTMRFTVTEKKQTKMRRTAENMLRQAAQGKKMVSGSSLSSFCGPAVSLTLSVPLARFCKRSMYEALTYAKRERDGTRARVRLDGFSQKDLHFWRKLGPEGGSCGISRPL